MTTLPTGLPPADVPSRSRARVRQVERATIAVRWFAVPFLVLSTMLFEPTATDVAPSVDLTVAAFTMGAGLVLAQICGHRALAALADDDTLARRWGLVALALDVAVASSVPIVYAFDYLSVFWPVLTFPIVEGAMRAGMRGSLTVWTVSAGTFVANSIRILDTRPNPESWINGMPWSAGILLMVALGTGSLGQRVIASDLAIDRWRERLHHLTSHTDRFVLLDQVSMRSSAQDLLDDLLPHHRAVLLDGGVPEPDWADDASLRLAVRSPDGQDLGLVVIDEQSAALDDDDRSLLDLLVRHLASALALARSTAQSVARAAELHASALARNDFLEELAHELRTPTTVIAGNARMLDHYDELADDTRSKVRRMLLDNVERLNRLVREATESMTSDDAILQLSMEPTDVVPLVRTAVAAETDDADTHRVSITVDGKVPAVSADADRVLQILYNLLGNAVRYSPEGGDITVIVSDAGRTVSIAVSDTGIGIPADRVPRLFGRLARLHPELDIPGTGLGLHLSRSLARAMGGDILVETAQGDGSTFTLELLAHGGQATDETRPEDGSVP